MSKLRKTSALAGVVLAVGLTFAGATSAQAAGEMGKVLNPTVKPDTGTSATSDKPGVELKNLSAANEVSGNVNLVFTAPANSTFNSDSVAWQGYGTSSGSGSYTCVRSNSNKTLTCNNVYIFLPKGAPNGGSGSYQSLMPSINVSYAAKEGTQYSDGTFNLTPVNGNFSALSSNLQYKTSASNTTAGSFTNNTIEPGANGTVAGNIRNTDTAKNAKGNAVLTFKAPSNTTFANGNVTYIGYDAAGNESYRGPQTGCVLTNSTTITCTLADNNALTIPAGGSQGFQVNVAVDSSAAKGTTYSDGSLVVSNNSGNISATTTALSYNTPNDAEIPVVNEGVALGSVVAAAGLLGGAAWMRRRKTAA